MDIQKQIDYWRNSSEEDMEVAGELLEKHRFRHALLFAHLALEKMLKAHVTRKTTDVPPKLHNLARLVELSGLSMPPKRQRFLDRFDVYQMEGRYPEELKNIHIDPEDAQQLLVSAKEMLQWLTAQL